MIAAFNESFVKSGEIPARFFLQLRDGFEDRAEGDYGLAEITEEQARAGIAAAHEFVDEIARRIGEAMDVGH